MVSGTTHRQPSMDWSLSHAESRDSPAQSRYKRRTDVPVGDAHPSRRGSALRDRPPYLCRGLDQCAHHRLRLLLVPSAGCGRLGARRSRSVRLLTRNGEFVDTQTGDRRCTCRCSTSPSPTGSANRRASASTRRRAGSRSRSSTPATSTPATTSSSRASSSETSARRTCSSSSPLSSSGSSGSTARDAAALLHRVRRPLRLPRRLPQGPLHLHPGRRGRPQLPVRRVQGLLPPRRPAAALHGRAAASGTCTRRRDGALRA